MMVVAQARLIPLYRAAGFTAGVWSFTFPWAAMATLALRWLALEHPAGHRAYAWVVIALATVLVVARAAVEIARRSQRLLSIPAIAHGDMGRRSIQR